MLWACAWSKDIDDALHCASLPNGNSEVSIGVLIKAISLTTQSPNRPKLTRCNFSLSNAPFMIFFSHTHYSFIFDCSHSCSTPLPHSPTSFAPGKSKSRKIKNGLTFVQLFCFFPPFLFAPHFASEKIKKNGGNFFFLLCTLKCFLL